jgi:excisionase family DNA binding protein
MTTTETVVMTVAEAAERIGKTEHWYATQLRARKLPGHKIGRQWKITAEDLQAALDSFAVPAQVVKRDPSGLTSLSRRRHTRR